MIVSGDNKLQNIIIIGDKVLIKPTSPAEKTKSGLLLPPGVREKEKVQTGYISKCGPGYPLPPAYDYEDEPWKDGEEEPQYIPLQAREGDLALYLQKDAIEINFEGEKMYIVSQNALLMLVREEDL